MSRFARYKCGLPNGSCNGASGFKPDAPFIHDILQLVAAPNPLHGPGAILSVPMLAITKIICDRVRPLAAFGHFLEG